MIGVCAIESDNGKVSKFRLTFNGPMDPKTVTPANIKVTGPTGQAVRVISVRQLPVAGTVFEVTVAPQALTGTGGVRVWVSPAVQSLWPKPLDQDNDGTRGRSSDFFSAAVHRGRRQRANCRRGDNRLPTDHRPQHADQGPERPGQFDAFVSSATSRSSSSPPTMRW